VKRGAGTGLVIVAGALVALTAAGAAALVVLGGRHDSSVATTVSWTTPEDGITVSGRLSSTAHNCLVSTSSGAGIDHVSFYLDGALLNTEQSAPYSCVWNTATAADGSSHDLEAVAVDTNGYRASASVTVTARNHAESRSGGPSTAIPHTGAVAKQDLASDLDFLSVWHQLNPDVPSRVEWHPTGGDPHPLVDGRTSDSWRRISIQQGDQAANDSGRMRMQLGQPYVTSDSSTFKVYNEGERWVTYWSMRIPGVNIPAGTGAQVWEMYQNQTNGGPPVLSFGVRSNNVLELHVKPPGEDNVNLWRAEVPSNTWLRFAVDIEYTTDGNNAKIQLWGDPDGDAVGDLSLRRLTPLISGYPTLFGGGSVSLLAGIYGDDSLPAHHIDFANWQVAEWVP
jgi:Big-like domain-containing protein